MSISSSGSPCGRRSSAAPDTVAITRRSLLKSAAAGAAALWCDGAPRFATADDSPPVTGLPNGDLAPFDRLMTSFLKENHVPGASLAVARHGKLVYARGFGFADVERGEAVQPGALFRIASVSKPLTAVAVLQLVERGKLGLDDPVTSRMKVSRPAFADARFDPRWEQVTIRHCLQHTGGWDRAASFDPIGRPWQIARTLGIQPPVNPDQIVQYMLGCPLDFDPGQRFAYSNFGYVVLGRIIEAVSGLPYESQIMKEVLAPIGVSEARLGRALLEHRADKEVRYYDSRHRMGPALYPPRLGEEVPLPYGAENLEAFEAHGGWIASAPELVRFAGAFDDPDKSPLLKAESISRMCARPDGAAGTEAGGNPKDVYYGCGWMVRHVGSAGKVNLWHTGLIAGTEALLVRRWDGLDWAVLFNTADDSSGKSLAGLIDGRIHEAAGQVKVWPDTDQFPEFIKPRA